MADKGQRVYLGSYTSSGGGGIGVGSFDPANGQMVVETWADRVADPSWLAVSGDRRTLYAVSELDPDGRVAALRVNDDGPPTLLNDEPTGQIPCHICAHPNGQVLFVSNYGDGTVAVHPIHEDGRVGAATDIRQHGGNRQPHAHQVVVDPSGRWILAADLGADAIYVYQLDDNRLRQHARVPFNEGAGPRNLAFHPGGDYAYVAGELNSTVTVCRWRDGELATTQVVDTLLKPPNPENALAEVLVSADGRFGYVGNRGDNSTAIFETADDGASLQLIDTSPCGGDWPRHTTIDPTGRWLFVANQRSGEVVWFELDADTGLPAREAGRVPATAVTHVLFV